MQGLPSPTSAVEMDEYGDEEYDRTESFLNYV